MFGCVFDVDLLRDSCFQWNCLTKRFQELIGFWRNVEFDLDFEGGKNGWENEEI